MFINISIYDGFGTICFEHPTSRHNRAQPANKGNHTGHKRLHGSPVGPTQPKRRRPLENLHVTQVRRPIRRDRERKQERRAPERSRDNAGAARRHHGRFQEGQHQVDAGDREDRKGRAAGARRRTGRAQKSTQARQGGARQDELERHGPAAGHQPAVGRHDETERGHSGRVDRVFG